MINKIIIIVFAFVLVCQGKSEHFFELPLSYSIGPEKHKSEGIIGISYQYSGFSRDPFFRMRAEFDFDMTNEKGRILLGSSPIPFLIPEIGVSRVLVKNYLTLGFEFNTAIMGSNLIRIVFKKTPENLSIEPYYRLTGYLNGIGIQNEFGIRFGFWLPSNARQEGE
jgi:hypothetical protein